MIKTRQPYIFLACFDWLITNQRPDDHRNRLADYHCFHRSPNASIVDGHHLECPFFSILAIRRCNWFCLTGTREFPWIRLKKVLLSPLFTLKDFSLLTSMVKIVLNRQNSRQARHVNGVEFVPSPTVISTHFSTRSSYFRNCLSDIQRLKVWKAFKFEEIVNLSSTYFAFKFYVHGTPSTKSETFIVVA